MFRICTLLGAVAIVASAPSSLEAKNPKGCTRTNVRPANPHGSVLMQPVARSAAVGRPGRVPSMVFGSPQRAVGVRATRGTVVPSITSEPGPSASSIKSRRKARKPGRSAAITPSSFLGAAAISVAASC
jgi:hypothetical protein